MATIAAAAIVAGAGIYASSASAKSAKGQLEEQGALAAAIREENKKYAEAAYKNSNNLLDELGNIQDYIDDGKEVSDTSRAELLKFVLGDTEGNARSAQTTYSQLANFDFTNVNKNIQDIFRSQQFDLVAMNGGQPVGQLANLSAQNAFNFAQQGLSNYIGISDFFARTGQTDRFNPYNIATDLFKVDESKTQTKIQLEQRKADQIIGINSSYVGQFADISNGKIAATNAEYAGYTQAIANGVKVAFGGIGYSAQKSNTASQTSFYSNLGKQAA